MLQVNETVRDLVTRRADAADERGRARHRGGHLRRRLLRVETLSQGTLDTVLVHAGGDEEVRLALADRHDQVADLVNATRRGRFLARWLNEGLDAYLDHVRSDAPLQISAMAAAPVEAHVSTYLNAYLDDHAFLLDATLELLQCEFRAADLDFARVLADRLAAETGLSVGVVNARFAKPIDATLLVRQARERGLGVFEQRLAIRGPALAPPERVQ